MKNTPKDGGPAFPNRSENTENYPIYDGMSLRDWFAGQAMSGLATLHPDPCLPSPAESLIALTAYKLADAMLLAREKGPQ